MTLGAKKMCGLLKKRKNLITMPPYISCKTNHDCCQQIPPIGTCKVKGNDTDTDTNLECSTSSDCNSCRCVNDDGDYVGGCDANTNVCHSDYSISCSQDCFDASGPRDLGDTDGDIYCSRTMKPSYSDPCGMCTPTVEALDNYDNPLLSYYCADRTKGSTSTMQQQNAAPH